MNTTDEYKTVDGTSYHVGTPEAVVRILEETRRSRTRLHLLYPVDSEPSERGYVGRTTGSRKVPILLHNSRSLGGGLIMCDRIVEIRESRGGKVLWKKS
jgi:hypothetical protein